LPEHLRDALWKVESAGLEPWDSPGGIIVAGMGGSAIGGELARAVLGDHASRPLLTARAYGLPVRDAPTVDVGAEQVALRLALIQEEVGELAAAAVAGDLIGIADALADIVYVAYGTAHVYGIDLDAVLDEVHASNMTKLGADGRPIWRADGKVLKGPDYRPPDIAAVLARS